MKYLLKLQRKDSDIVFAVLSVHPSVCLSDSLCYSCVIWRICFHFESPLGLFNVWVLRVLQLLSHILLFSSRPRQFVPGVDHADLSLAADCFLFDLLLSFLFCFFLGPSPNSESPHFDILWFFFKAVTLRESQIIPSPLAITVAAVLGFLLFSYRLSFLLLSTTVYLSVFCSSGLSFFQSVFLCSLDPLSMLWVCYLPSLYPTTY